MVNPDFCFPCCGDPPLSVRPSTGEAAESLFSSASGCSRSSSSMSRTWNLIVDLGLTTTRPDSETTTSPLCIAAQRSWPRCHSMYPPRASCSELLISAPAPSTGWDSAEKKRCSLETSLSMASAVEASAAVAETCSSSAASPPAPLWLLSPTSCDPPAPVPEPESDLTSNLRSSQMLQRDIGAIYIHVAIHLNSSDADCSRLCLACVVVGDSTGAECLLGLSAASSAGVVCGVTALGDSS